MVFASTLTASAVFALTLSCSTEVVVTPVPRSATAEVMFSLSVPALPPFRMSPEVSVCEAVVLFDSNVSLPAPVVLLSTPVVSGLILLYKIALYFNSIYSDTIGIYIEAYRIPTFRRSDLRKN
jgi:hypothetical protein